MTSAQSHRNTLAISYPSMCSSDSKAQRECFAEHSFYHADSSDEGNACGFSNSKVQRERFAEHYDFSATNTTIRDEETGYGYFGARYMDHELMTMWLSVDPMADKYPGISPYAYCAWNPVKLVDPDGREIWIAGEKGTFYQYKKGKLYTHDGKLYEGNDSFANKVKCVLNDIQSINAGRVVIAELEESTKRYVYTNESPSNKKSSACFVDESRKFKMGPNSTNIDFAHETFHAYQCDLGDRGQTVNREIGARLFATLISFELYGKNSWNMQNQLAGIPGEFSDAMNNLLFSGFNENDYAIAINSFFTSALSGPVYSGIHYSIGKISNNPPIKQFIPIK